MRADKYDRMIAEFTGHHGPATVDAVMSEIPEELFDRLTGRELGLVMSAVNAAYHAGRGSAGAEAVDEGGVWVDHLRRIVEL